jgi:chromosome segregation ATPase
LVTALTQNSNLLKELSELRNHNRELIEERNKYKSINDDLHRQIYELTDDNALAHFLKSSVYKEAKHKNEQLTAQVAELQATITNNQKEIQMLQETSSRAEKCIDGLSNDNEELNNKIKELEMLDETNKENVSHLENEIESLHTQNNILSNNIVEIETQYKLEMKELIDKNTNDYETLCTTHNETYAALLSENMNMTARISELESSLEEITQRNAMEESEVIEEQKQRIKELEESLNQQHMATMSIEEMYETEKQENEEMSQRIKNMENTLLENETQLHNLASVTEANMLSEKECEVLRSKCHSLEEKTKAMQEKILILESENERLSFQNTSDESRIMELESEIMDLTERIHDLEQMSRNASAKFDVEIDTKLKELKSQNKELTAQLRDVQHELDLSKVSHSTQSAELMEEYQLKLVQLEMSLKEEQEKYVELEIEHANALEQLESAKFENEEFSRQLKSSYGMLANYESKTSNQVGIIDAKNRAEEECERLQLECDNLSRRVKQLEASSDSHNSQVQRLTATNSKAELRVRELHEENEKLQNQVDELLERVELLSQSQNSADKLTDMFAENASLKNDVQQKNSELMVVKGTVEELRKKTSQLQVQLDAEENKYNIAMKEKVCVEENLESMIVENEKLSERIRLLEAAVSDYESGNPTHEFDNTADMRRENDDLRHKLQQLEASHNTQIQKLSETNAKAESRISELLDENSKLVFRVEDLEDALQSKEGGDFNTTSNDFSHFDYENIMSENSRLRNELKVLESASNHNSTECSRLTAEKHNLDEEIERLRFENEMLLLQISQTSPPPPSLTSSLTSLPPPPPPPPLSTMPQDNPPPPPPPPVPTSFFDDDFDNVFRLSESSEDSLEGRAIESEKTLVNEMLIARNKDIHNDLINISRSNEDLKQQLSSLQSSFDNYKQSKSREIESLEFQIKSLVDFQLEVSRLNDKCKEYEADIQLLEAKLESNNNHARNAGGESGNGEMEGIINELIETKMANATMSSELDQERRKNSNMKRKLQEYAERVASLEVAAAEAIEASSNSRNRSSPQSKKSFSMSDAKSKFNPFKKDRGPPANPNNV